LFLILLSYPAVSGVADDTFDPGRSNPFNFPLFKIPTRSNPDSGTAKEKEKQDKKVDDAIKQAWEER